jgi:uncharacterized hydrophobic protein (TIGR00271 family)
VVSPPGLTERLTGLLTAEAGVLNLVVLPGAARCPGGDSVSFDVRDGAANQILTQLRSCGLDHDRPVVIQVVDAVMAVPERHGTAPGSRFREIAPVWDLISARIRDDATYAPSFFVLLVIAGLIGAVGILTNSTILIVAAMVVGPEYNAIISVAFGVEQHDFRAVRIGLLVLTGGFLGAIAAALLFALCIEWLGLVPAPFLAGLRPVSDLINSPDLFSVVIAVLAGIVGVVSLTESRASALIGVFISVTTIPAAAAVGVSVAFGLWREAGGSALQLLLNAGLLIVVGALALRLQRWIWRDRSG